MSLSELDQARKQLAVMREQRDALAESLQKMLTDYRTEGCPDKECCVCKDSKAAEDKARVALAKVGVK